MWNLLSSLTNNFREGCFPVVIISSLIPEFRNEHSSNHDQIWCALLVSVQRVAAPVASDMSTLYISAVFWYGTSFALIFLQN